MARSMAFVLLMSGLLVFQQAANAAEASWRYMPPGYAYPNVDTPRVEPGDVDRLGGLRIAEANKIFHLIQLDRSPLKWADNTLRISIGLKAHWNINDFYALFPSGYETAPNRATAFVATAKIDFPSVFNPASGNPIRSVNRPDHTLTRHDEFLVLQKGDERRWYFESPDGGNRWRLAKIELIKHPGMFTRLIYEDERVVAIEFPNETHAEIEYENDLPVRIRTPFEETVEIQRGVGGYASQISIRRGGDTNPKHTIIYRYAHDEHGRMTKFVNEFGTEYRIDYLVDEGVEEKTRTTTYTIRVHNRSDNTFFAREHITKDSGEWVISDHVGAKDSVATTPFLDQVLRMKAVNKRWSVVGRSVPEAGRQVNYELDGFGNAEVQVDALGRSTIRKHDGLGNVIEELRPSGGRVVQSFNQFGQRTRRIDEYGREQLYGYDPDARLIKRIDHRGEVTRFEYDERGFPVRTYVGHQSYRFRFDDWGRLVELFKPGGDVERWTYDAAGRLVTVTLASRLPEDFLEKHPPEGYPAEYGTQRFEYDHLNRLVGIQYHNGGHEQYAYDKFGRLIRHVEPDGNTIAYQYDRSRRLKNRHDPNRGSDQYTYHPSGRTKQHRHRETGQKWIEDHYDETGNLVEKRVSGVGSTRYEYDVAGRCTKVIHPDDTTTLYEYDQQDRVIAVKGTHQPAVDSVSNDSSIEVPGVKQNGRHSKTTGGRR